MKYYAYFKDDIVNCHWIKEDDSNDHPSYIPKDEIQEITLEQHENAHQLILDGGTVKYDPIKRAASLARKQKRDTSKSNIAEIKAAKNLIDNDDSLKPYLKKLLNHLVNELN